jgi:hypothetical protein
VPVLILLVPAHHPHDRHGPLQAGHPLVGSSRHHAVGPPLEAEDDELGIDGAGESNGKPVVSLRIVQKKFVEKPGVIRKVKERPAVAHITGMFHRVTPNLAG